MPQHVQRIVTNADKEIFLDLVRGVRRDCGPPRGEGKGKGIYESESKIFVGPFGVRKGRFSDASDIVVGFDPVGGTAAILWGLPGRSPIGTRE